MSVRGQGEATGQSEVRERSPDTVRLQKGHKVSERSWRGPVTYPGGHGGHGPSLSALKGPSGPELFFF